MKKILVVGGGAAGLMAAYSAAQYGANVTVLEKMPAIGRKILITGKGRCNLTNSCEMSDFIKNMLKNGKFLYASFAAFTNEDIMNFMQDFGVPTKVERGGRVFPVSDKAADVVNAFSQALKKLNVQVITHKRVKELLTEGQAIAGVITEDAEKFTADAVILATGGASYPGTGSTGDGYALARKLGHSVIPLKPSLVPLEVTEEWITDIQGLSLKNVTATIFSNQQKISSEFGEMLFTHFGLSGPIILSLSRVAAELLAKKQEFYLEVNLKPALTPDVLDKRLQRDFEKFSRKQLKNSLNDLLPQKIIDTIIDLAYLDGDKPVHQLTKEERQRLLLQIQHLTFSIKGTRPISEAIVTAGGVDTKEINPASLQSKRWENLYFAGELIDVDGYTGGFNLQAAFSTGYLAGKSAAL